MSTKSPSSYSPEVLDFFTELFPDGVVFFDLETTGLSPLCDKIIEFAGIKIEARKTYELSFLTNPDVEILPDNEKIHGISNEMVKTAKTQTEAAKEIESFIKGCALVAHNSLFDFGFLLTLAQENHMSFQDNPVYCSCRLSRKVNKQFNSHKLSSLAESFHIPLENHHRATDDTRACLEIFLKTLKSTESPKQALKDGFLFKGKDFKSNNLSEMTFPKHLEALPELVRNKSIFEIMYTGGTKKNQFRKVQGVSLLPRPNGNVLYAFCRETKLYKYYKLKKIKEIRQ